MSLSLCEYTKMVYFFVVPRGTFCVRVYINSDLSFFLPAMGRLDKIAYLLSDVWILFEGNPTSGEGVHLLVRGASGCPFHLRSRLTVSIFAFHLFLCWLSSVINLKLLDLYKSFCPFSGKFIYCLLKSAT